MCLCVAVSLYVWQAVCGSTGELVVSLRSSYFREWVLSEHCQLVFEISQPLRAHKVSTNQQGPEAHELLYGLSAVCCRAHKSEFTMDFLMLLFLCTTHIRITQFLDYDINRDIIFHHEHACSVCVCVNVWFKCLNQTFKTIFHPCWFSFFKLFNFE